MSDEPFELFPRPRFLLPVQERLLPYENPLIPRLGAEFFKSVPQTPGIYIMRGADGEILYVGKAKNLRVRLNSYKRARPETVSRKVLRLLHFVVEIVWEECESEMDALIRENRLLREEDPPFNVLNTRPDTYYFIVLKPVPGGVIFRLTMHENAQKGLIFGAFKGRALVREGYAALLRLIWVSQNGDERFEWPTRLTRRTPPNIYTIDLPQAWWPNLKRLLSGASDKLLVELTERLLTNEKIPRWVYALIQEDIETVREFYERCPWKNRGLRRHHGVKGRVIHQDELDDLLVRELARKGVVDSGGGK